MGTSENTGHATTFKVFKDESHKIIFWSNARLSNDTINSNLLIDPATIPTIVKSMQDVFADDDTVSTAPSTTHDYGNYQGASPMPIIENSDLVGRSFLTSAPEDNQRLGTKMFKALDARQEDLKDGPAIKEFVVTANEDTVEKIMSCNEILDHAQNQNDQDPIAWSFKRITSHEGPFP